jgi:hypothetical protein
MRRSMRLSLVPPRTVSRPTNSTTAEYQPWVEVSVLARFVVPAWDVEETAWVHRAAPIDGGVADVERVVGFDPGRRAATPGAPPSTARAGAADLGEEEALRICRAIADRWRPSLHFHPRLRLVSRVDEPSETFRRRCLAVMLPALRKLDAAHRALETAKLLAEVESRELDRGELVVLVWRVGVGWYPSGTEPSPAPGDPMMLDLSGPRG